MLHHNENQKTSRNSKDSLSEWYIYPFRKYLLQYFLRCHPRLKHSASTHRVHASTILGIMCACVHAQFCPTLCNPMDFSPPGASVHGLAQATILEWIAISCSRGFLPTQGLNLSLASPALAGVLFTTAPLRVEIRRIITIRRIIRKMLSLMRWCVCVGGCYDEKQIRNGEQEMGSEVMHEAHRRYIWAKLWSGWGKSLGCSLKELPQQRK